MAYSRIKQLKMKLHQRFTAVYSWVYNDSLARVFRGQRKIYILDLFYFENLSVSCRSLVMASGTFGTHEDIRNPVH